MSVTIKGDTIVEANETFTVNLGAITGTTAAAGAAITSTDTATGTINNDDSASLSIGALTTTETNADFNVNFAVTLDHDVQGGFDVAISSTSGTADGSDYTLNTTTLHFAGTVGESHHVSVTIKGDTVVEANETFTVNLGAVTGTTATQIAAITSTATATGTITNDDSATLSIGDATTTETNADFNANFVVTLDHAVQGGFDVAISSTSGTADGTDYTLNTTTLHFAGTVGESHPVSVTIKGDTVVEQNETFTVNLARSRGQRWCRRPDHQHRHGHRHDHQR